MGLIVSRWSSMLSFTAILTLVAASGCRTSSWSIPGMGWMGGSKKDAAATNPPIQPAASQQSAPSANASKYLTTPPTISTGTPGNYAGNTVTSTKTYSNGNTTAYSGRNTIGPYHPPKSKTVTTTLPQAGPFNPQYSRSPGTQYPPTQYPTTQYPATQYPATQSQVGQSQVGQSQVGQYPATQSQVGQYPATQSQVGQYPATQSQVGQYPATQSQAGQYPTRQSQVGQYPSAYPNTGYAPPTKTADARSVNAGSNPTAGNYQRGFYAPERPVNGAAKTQPYPTGQPAPTNSYPQNGTLDKGAARTYSPTAPGQFPAKAANALPVTQYSTSATGQAPPYAAPTTGDPYSAQSLKGADNGTNPASPFPTQTSPAPYRPGSTGRLNPTSVPQQQEVYPNRGSQFNAYGN